MSATSEPLERDQFELFNRARAGDQAAWEELFKTCYPKVIRVVRRRLDRPMRSLYDSTDFASDVMKSLAANLDRLDFESIGSLVAFLARVAEQKVIDEHRRRYSLKRDVSRERAIDAENAANESALASDYPTPSQFAQAGDVREQLLAELDTSERKVIELRQLGYDNAEIATLTGWNIRKVQRFLKELQDSLRDSGTL